MILTVTLNAALDVTYRVDRLRPHTSHRVRSVAERAGGKGINVARVLNALARETTGQDSVRPGTVRRDTVEHEIVVTGLAGGAAGAALREELATAGLRDRLVPIAGSSRRTVAVVDEQAGDTTILLEPGPVVTDAEWAHFLDQFDRLLPRAAALVLAGSLPGGVPADAYAVLLRRARAHGVPAVLDADGAPLLAGLAEAPAVVKPNAAELTAATGESDPWAAARALRAAGARAVVASLGADGLIAVTSQGSWQVRPPRRLAGNPTGAGDAAVAALALGLITQAPWPVRLAQAVALSAAAVAAPLAGDFDHAVYRGLLDQLDVAPSPPLSPPCSPACSPPSSPENSRAADRH
ncbi:1-phosphofructokinase family hexose kinase [Kitasatospora sp. GAS1066B]|uniref:1-phosphofructokinase family hexose kinase n=1 Tax=Kitasatospora sp. GAS1066B TaxID=3156271 RepID=UPI00351611A5